MESVFVNKKEQNSFLVILKEELVKFHQNEQGDVLQKILIVFLAVLLLLAIGKFFFEDVFNSLKDKIKELMGLGG